MNTIRNLVFCGVLAAGATGCAHTSTPVTLPAGAINSFDADTFRVLADAHALITSIRADVVSGAIVLTPTQKAQFNDFIQAENTADDLYKAYKAANGNVDTTALSKAIATVLQDISVLTSITKNGGN